jgi:hypothetical protein
MGTKRIGLARTQALIENLKRELALGDGTVLKGQRREVIALTNAATTAKALAATESGALVTLNPSTNAAQTITVTLPAPEAGVSFDFAMVADAGNTGADVIVKTTANGVDIIGAIVAGEASNTNLVNVGHSKITFDAGETAGQTLGGLMFSVVCDGSNYYLTQFTTPADVTTAHVGTSGKAIILSTNV